MRNILVVNRLGIGDTVLTTPLAQAIKQYFPNVRVGFVVAPKSADLLKNHPYIDDVFVYQKHTKSETIEQIKVSEYTDAVIVDERLSSSALAWRAGCKLRNIGKVVSIFGRRWLSSKLEKSNTAIEHYTKYMKYLDKNYEYKYMPPIIGDIADEDYNRIINWMNPINNTVGKKVLVVPRGVAENKNWPIQHFNTLNQYLNSKGIVPIYIGAEKDKEYMKRIKGEIINIAGDFNLRELAVLAKQMDVCITVCTGPMHVISTANTPIIALYGPTDPSYWAPPHATVIKADNAPCQMCRRVDCDNYPIKFDCMQRLSPDLVVEQINRLLEIKQ